MTFPNVPLTNQWTDGEELNATKMNARIDARLNSLIPGFTTYTPTWTGLTVGNANNQGFYRLVGKILSLKIVIVTGSTTTTPTTSYTFSLPPGQSATSSIPEQWIFAGFALAVVNSGFALVSANGTTMSLFNPGSTSSSSFNAYNSAGISTPSGSRIIVTGDLVVN